MIAIDSSLNGIVSKSSKDHFNPDRESSFWATFTDLAITQEVAELNIYDVGDVSYVASAEDDENDDLFNLIVNLGLEDRRVNGGQISRSVTTRVRKYGGGWANRPFFGLADRDSCNYFHFKPKNPEKDYKGRLIKYVGAQGVPSRLFTPNVPESIWAVIACRYNAEKTGSSFWQWILEHPEIPVIVTEGLKKGLAGISTGYPVAATNGCHGGFISIKEDDGTSQGHRLIPDLKALAEGGRTIYLALDREIIGKTKRTVHKATKVLASLLAEQGCEVYTIKWDNNHYKGLDDFIAGAGIDAFKLAIENATNITPQPKSEKQKLPPPLEVAAVVADRLFNTLRYDASTSEWWKYDGMGKWAPTYDVSVFKLVTEYLDQTLPAFLPSYVENVIKFARNSALVESWEEASSLDFIPFTNGVLNLKTNELLHHSPDYNFTWRLPRSYSVLSTNWDNISNFLDTLTGSNKQLKFLAIAFCNAVLKGRADLQKFLYLFGSGANGKGVFSSLLQMLIGKENTHATTIKDLTENRFEPSNLKGKRLLLMSDEDQRSGGIGIFKSVTGQDPIRYERKGKDSTNFVFEGITIVAANSPTFIGVSNTALKRRKVDFPCLVTVKESDRRDLKPEFTADLPAFTTYLLSLPDEWVTATIRGASSVEAVKRLNWEMTVREDSIAAFLDVQLIIDPDKLVSSSDIYSSYQTFCLQNGLKPKSQTNFTPSLVELCTSLGHDISKRKAKTGNFLHGVRLRLPSDPFSLEEEPIPSDEGGGYGGLVEGMVEGLNPCLEPRVEGMEGYSLLRAENEKKVVKEGVANSYHQNKNKKVCLERNVEIPSTPSTPSTSIPEVLLDKASSGGGLETQPSTCLHLPPPFALKVGDQVKYIGQNPSLQKQYAGVLEVYEVSNDGYACLKSDGSLTSWIEAADLRLLED
jgi:putative DNA primase/helicase